MHRKLFYTLTGFLDLNWKQKTSWSCKIIEKRMQLAYRWNKLSTCWSELSVCRNGIGLKSSSSSEEDWKWWPTCVIKSTLLEQQKINEYVNHFCKGKRDLPTGKYHHLLKQPSNHFSFKWMPHPCTTQGGKCNKLVPFTVNGTWQS